jgi:hypothetical protein
MEYIALIQQKGEGCDYTIACGKDWLFIEAEDDDGAAMRLLSEISENYTGERKLKSATLIKVLASVELPIAEFYKSLDEENAAVFATVEKQKRRAEYERLKAEFN